MRASHRPRCQRTGGRGRGCADSPPSSAHAYPCRLANCKSTLALDRTTGRFEELRFAGPYAAFLGDESQTMVDIGGGRGLVNAYERVFEVSVGPGAELRVDFRLWWLPYTVQTAKGVGGRNILLTCTREGSDLPPKHADFVKGAPAARWRAAAG
jgi:hypothetical protein